MEKEVAELQEATNLFDVTIPDYRDIKLCRREIIILKELWDLVIFVQVSTVLIPKLCQHMKLSSIERNIYTWSST